MCQFNDTKKYDWIYSGNVTANKLNNLHNLQNINIDKELREYLLNIFTSKEIPELSPVLLNYYYEKFQAANALKNARNIYTARSSSNSIYNFVVAKTNVYLNNIKKLINHTDDIEVLKTFTNLILSTQSKIEEDHVRHISNQYKEMTSSNRSDDLLHYKSMEDNRVRHDHELADGTVLPKSDSFWNTTALTLLAQWNCRCHVIPVDNMKINYKGKDKVYKNLDESGYISDLDLKSGKAGIFTETLPAFQNANPITRKYYRKLNDPIYPYDK